MEGNPRRNYTKIVSSIYLALPFTLIKQRLFYRFRKPPAGLPDFLCIGTQKSGTTWLHDQLKRHPRVCMAELKEVHYFDWLFYRSFRWYLSHFRCNAGQLRGEVTPGYSIIEKGRIRFIRRTMPHVKLILLLRDPRERAWSSARFRFGKQLGRDPGKVSTEEFIRHFETGWVKQRGDYETIWKKWTSVFPREQFLGLFSEEISSQPANVMKKVCDFLGVEMLAENETLRERPNESEPLAMPKEVKEYLDKMYWPVMRRMGDILGIKETPWKP